MAGAVFVCPNRVLTLGSEYIGCDDIDTVPRSFGCLWCDRVQIGKRQTQATLLLLYYVKVEMLAEVLVEIC